MSWEIMRTETGPCECGEGTETFTFEMDDWNRTRSSTEIHCPKCREKKQRQIEAEQSRERKRDEHLQRARQLATERYLAQWLALFAGMTKKAAWERTPEGPAIRLWGRSTNASNTPAALTNTWSGV